MPWFRKEQPTPFDDQAIEGMAFLHGDVLSKLYRQDWIRGKKYPLITFPSGTKRELIDPQNPHPDTTHVHIFGIVDLPYQGTSDDALARIAALPEEAGVLAMRRDSRSIVIGNRYSGRSYQIQYDDEARQLLDLKAFPPTAMELLDGQSRALLPPLYANEKLGLEAVAPIKFFTPDANWTWWPTEFDGDDLFFGLVSGFVVELGYFTASELESVLGPLHLPIERDLYYQPQTLAELKRLSER